MSWDRDLHIVYVSVCVFVFLGASQVTLMFSQLWELPTQAEVPSNVNMRPGDDGCL